MILADVCNTGVRMIHFRFERIFVCLAGFLTGIVMWLFCAPFISQPVEYGQPTVQPTANAGVQDLGIGKMVDIHAEAVPSQTTQVMGKVSRVEPEKWYGRCNVVYLTEMPYGSFTCPKLNMSPFPSICLHSADSNAYTQSLYDQVVIDRERHELFTAQLLQDPDVHVIDINSLYGTSGLIAARLGCQVVFVQTNQTHVDTVITSLVSSRGRNNRTMIARNGINKDYRILPVRTPPQLKITPNVTQRQETVPTVVLDDLLELIHFKKAIVTLDIGTDDMYTFHKGGKLLSTIYIPYIFVKFNVSTQERNNMFSMLAILYKHFFRAYTLKQEALAVKDLENWPRDIVWKHIDATFVSTKYFSNY